MRLVSTDPSEFLIENLPSEPQSLEPCPTVDYDIANGFILSEKIVLDFCLGICDIGSATFNYDMRRLNEILDFPKAWYKRGLVQRLFLGKEGSYATKTSATGSEMSPEVPSSNKPTDEDLKRR